MTEQTKIPVPPEDEAKAQGPSLIERVVRNYDLVRLAPAPIPADLVPPASKRRRYRRADEVIEEAEVSPVAEAVEAAPEVVEPEVIVSAPVPAPVKAKPPVPALKSVEFTGARLPVNPSICATRV